MGRPPGFELLNLSFLFSATFQTGLLDVNADVLLGGASLEGGFASLEVPSMILGADDDEEEEVGSDDTDKDTLDESVVGYDLWAS